MCRSSSGRIPCRLQASNDLGVFTLRLVSYVLKSAKECMTNIMSEDDWRIRRLEEGVRELKRINRQNNRKIDKLTREKEVMNECLRNEMFSVEKLNAQIRLLTNDQEAVRYIQLLEETNENLLSERDLNHLRVVETSDSLEQVCNKINSLKEENQQLKEKTERTRLPPRGNQSHRVIRKNSTGSSKALSRSVIASPCDEPCGDLIKEFGRVKDQLLQATIAHGEAVCEYMKTPSESGMSLKLEIGRLECTITSLEQEKSQIEEGLYLSSK